MAQPDVVVNIGKKFAAFDDLWSPKIIAEANGWHMRDRTAELAAGDVFVVPKGVEHRPDAGEGCEMMMLEPAGVANTGTVVDELSHADQWI